MVPNFVLFKVDKKPKLVFKLKRMNKEEEWGKTIATRGEGGKVLRQIKEKV